MTISRMIYESLSPEFYTNDFRSEEQILFTKVKHLINGYFSNIYLVRASNNPSKSWVAKEPNERGVEVNGREATIIKVLNEQEKLEGGEYIVQLVAFFRVKLEDIDLPRPQMIGPSNEAPVMIFPHYKSDLFDLTRHCPMALDKALGIAKQLLKIAAFLERQKLVHRDIKPENIFINELGTIRLGDFGTAMWQEEDNPANTKQVAGTAEYLAPEIASWHISTRQLNLEERNLAPWSSRSDLWSIGCALFDLVDRHHLFDLEEAGSDKVEALVDLHKNFACPHSELKISEVRDIERYPALNSILLGLLQIDPNQRSSSKDSSLFS